MPKNYIICSFLMIFSRPKSKFLQVATIRECNFTMGTILGKGFAQSLVLLTVCTCACAKPFPKIVPMVKSDRFCLKQFWHCTKKRKLIQKHYNPSFQRRHIKCNQMIAADNKERRVGIFNYVDTISKRCWYLIQLQ